MLQLMKGLKQNLHFIPDTLEEANKYFKTTKCFNVNEWARGSAHMFVVKQPSEWNDDGVINGLVRKFLTQKGSQNYGRLGRSLPTI